MTTGLPIIVIAGPTASGKSALALELAERLDAEIVNADSQQVYRELEVGTAKPSARDRDRAVHHLVDVASIDEQLTAARFVELADQAIEGIHRRGRAPLVVGGSGLWLRALLRGLAKAPARDSSVRARLEAEAARGEAGLLHRRLREIDPESAERLHPNDTLRLVRALEVFELTGRPLSEHQRAHGFAASRYPHRLIALAFERDELRQRIERRAEAMLRSGWLEETRALLEKGVPRRRLSKVLGYGEVAAHLSSEATFEEMHRRVVVRTWRYAKRQILWLRKEPGVEWLAPPVDPARLAQDLIGWMSRYRS